MPTLYNTKTRKPESVPEDQLEQALMSGSHAYETGQRVNVRDEQGETFSVPTEKLNTALSSGFRMERTDEGAVREYVDQNKGLGGAVKVALGQFVDEAAMGIPELIFDKTQDPLEVAKKDALKKEHEFANNLGGVAGFGASFLVGAPVFKGAAKGGEFVAKHLAEKIISSSAGEVGTRTAANVAKEIVKKMTVGAAKLGTEGAIVAAPKAITEAALGDPEAAGETLAAGVGIGALLGAGGELAKPLFKMGKQAIKDRFLETELGGKDGMQKLFRNKAEEKAVEALNPTLSQQERLSNSKDIKKLGRFLIDDDIVTPLASKQTIYERIGEKTNQYGKEIGDYLQRADDTLGEAGLISPFDLAAKIEKTVVEKLGRTSALKRELSKFKSDLDDLAFSAMDDTGREIPWSLVEANAQKSAYTKKISSWGLDEKLHRDLIRNIDREINSAIESKVGGMGDEFLNGFKEAKTKFGYLKSAEEIAKKSAAREAKNNDFGLTSFITAAGAGAIGGLPLALGAFVAREGSRRYGDQIASYAYNKAAGLLFAEGALKAAAKRLDTIPQMLERMASSTKMSGKGETASVAGLLRLLGDDHKGLSKEEQVKKFTEKATIWASDPAHMAEQLAQLTTPVSSLGAPQIGGAMNTKMLQGFQYLFEQSPKAPRMKNPFAKTEVWKPTHSEVSAFHQKAQVVADPFSVLDELEAGSLTRNHVQALKAVYPKIYDMIKTKIMDSAINGTKPLSYQKRLKLSLLMESPLDQSLTPSALKSLQSAYSSPDQTLPGKGTQVNVAKGVESQAQRLQAM